MVGRSGFNFVTVKVTDRFECLNVIDLLANLFGATHMICFTLQWVVPVVLFKF